MNNTAGNILHLDLIRNAEDWDSLAEEWNTLLTDSHINTPFQTYEFQRTWWEGLGGGEWKNVELLIVTARRENGDLLGIAPLFATANHKLLFIGSHEIADYLDLIVRQDEHAEFCNQWVEFLKTVDVRWDALELYNLPDDSNTAIVLEAAARPKDLNFKTEQLKASPYVKLPASFEEYLEGLPSKQAHEMRRKLRRSARNPSPISVEFVREGALLHQALQDFFELMDKEPEKAAFLRRDGMRKQIETIAKAAFEAGWLQLVFLKIGPRRIAAYMNFDYENRIWAYNAAFDPEFAHLSPGWLLMAEMMKWCIENGREIFDFMRGAEDYKYRLGGIDRYVNKVTITKKS